MKILVMQASPNEDGLTATMAKEAMKGAKSVGAECELIHLKQIKLEACLACEDGWGRCRKESLCIIEDDLEKMRTLMSEADGIVLGTPVYFGEVAEVVKNFFDRLRRCERAGPVDPRVEGRWMLNIAAAGGGGGGGCLDPASTLPLPLLLGDVDHIHVLRPGDLVMAVREAVHAIEAVRCRCRNTARGTD